MNYKIGDRVIIKTDHPRGSRECETVGQHDCQSVNPQMASKKGQIATITEIVDNAYYRIDLDRWAWTDCMLSPYVETNKTEILKGVSSITKKPFIIKQRELPKIPYKSFKLGIELETLVPDEQENDLRDAVSNLPFEWDSDGSIETDSDTDGVEFKGERPFTYTELKAETKKLCDAFADNDVYINTSCGFHLHVSNKRFFTPLVMNRIILTWSAIEDFLLATQPRSRFNNTYCKRYLAQYVHDQKNGRKLLRGKQNLIDQLRSTNNGRYQTMNLQALSDHGTIEIRLHAGTTQYKKVIEWVNLMLLFFTYCLKNYNHREVVGLFDQKISDQKIANICNMLGLTEKQEVYFKGRVHKFLFDHLAKQQESAGKIIKNIKKIQKAQKKYTKAEQEYRTINRAYEAEYSNLQS